MNKFKKIIMALVIGMGITTSGIVAYNTFSAQATTITSSSSSKENSIDKLNFTNSDNSGNSLNNSGGCDHNCAACTNRCH